MTEREHRRYRRRLVNEIGNTFRRARVAKNLPQEQVAEAAGIATFTYASLERGHSLPNVEVNPTLDTLIRVCRVLEVDLRDLPDV